MSFPKALLSATVVAVSFLVNMPAIAQAYPNKPLQVISGFAAGGSFGAFCRIVADGLGERSKLAVVDDHKPGASGAIAAEYVAKAVADGSIFMVVEDTVMSISPLINPNLGYNPRDFTPISLSATFPVIVMAPPALGVKDMRGLVALAKSKPGSLSFASPGIGTSSQLTFEQLKAQAGIDMVHVPYKGGLNPVADLIENRIQLHIMSAFTATPFIKDGKLMALGVRSASRAPSLPDVPTFEEVGIPNFAYDVYYGVVISARTPKPMVNFLEREMRAILEMPQIRERIEKLNLKVEAGGSEAFSARIREDIARWSPIITRLGLRTN